MKFAFWLALYLLGPICMTAQSKTDSLKHILKKFQKKGDSYQISAYLSDIGCAFLNQQQYDSALHYYYESLKYISFNDKFTASTFNGIGVVYNQKAFPDSTIFYYSKALKLYNQLKDTANSIIINTNLAIIYKNKGLYERSLDYAFSALSMLEKQEPGRALASACNTIGIVYMKIGDYTNALVYHKRALAIRKQIGISKLVAHSYNNIGEIFIALHRYDSALSNLSRSLAIKKENDDVNGVGSTLYLMGETYVALHKAKEAESYFVESQKIKKKSGERMEEAMALNGIAGVKFLLHDLRETESYLNQAAVLILQTGALDELRKNLEMKVALYKAKANPIKALHYAEELLVIKDSLLNKEKVESLLAVQARYETEKKEQHIYILEQASVLQQAEIETKKVWIWSLVVITFLILVIGGLSFYNYRLNLYGKRKVETLLKELHHRVKNNLQILSSVLSLQSQHVKDDDAIQVIKSSESRVNTMALIHKKLYNDENSRAINMYDYAQELSGYLIHTYGYSENTITLDIRGGDIFVDVDKAIPVGLILNELISNALKYAYKYEKHPQLTVALTLHHQQELVIEVRDNGMGINATNKPDVPRSFGLKMVDTLVKELKGKMLIITDGGTAYFLQIPHA